MNDPDWSKYEAVIDKRGDYYRPRFDRFARGGWLSWNWAAFFGTLAWLRFRKLKAWSWAYFFVSTPFLLAFLMVSAGDPCERALDPGLGAATALAALSILGLGWIVPPLVANRLYYNHVRAIVAQTAEVKRDGGYAGALALQALVLCGAVVLGSALFSDYVYRSMVSEGVSLAAGAKVPVQEYENERRRLPGRIEEVAGNTSGKYVDRLVLESDGTIRAIFGARGRKLSGHSVSFVPVKKNDRIVEWVCRSTDLPDHCLPAGCRQPN